MKPGRNDSCPCGSGQKYKRCCERKERDARPHSSDAAALNNEGNALLARGLSADAAASFRRATELKPDFSEAHSNLGNSLRALGRFAEAARSCRRALKLKPDLVAAHCNLGIVLRALGQTHEAVQSFRRALEIDPTLAEGHNNLANALRDLGHAEAAIEHYRRAVAINPRYAAAFANWGNLLQSRADPSGAIDLYRQALLHDTGLVEVHHSLGKALQDLGRFEEAIASYGRALALQPNYRAAHVNLAATLRAVGRPTEALAACERALEFDASLVAAHCNRGNVLQDLGRTEEAIRCYELALELDPACAEAYNNLAGAWQDLARLDAAVAAYRSAIAANPKQAGAYNNLAIVLRMQGFATDAESNCAKALELDPDSPAALAFRAELHADRGEFTAAEAMFARALERDANLPQAWAGIARLRRMTPDDAAWYARAEALVARGLTWRHEVDLCFALGKYCDDVGDFDRAFAHYRRANELAKRHHAAFDREAWTCTVAEIMAKFDRAWLCRMRRTSQGSARAVLIVGMPRSGTTLAEQIIASHPDAHGAGELHFWNSALDGTGEPARAPEREAAQVAELGARYLELLARLSPDARRVVDKMPTNFLHLGFIHAALPEARIVHMRRDPIDTCLSIYFQHFSGSLAWSNDLEDLAHFYGEYAVCMRHWRETLPPDALLDVPYESLIAEPELWCRRLVDFAGLAWDPRCLEFHRSDRPVITTSRWQVRQQINGASVGRWRRYAAFVGPLLDLLESTPAGERATA